MSKRITATELAQRLAAALNEIDDLFGVHYDDFKIFDYVTHYGPLWFGVDIETFNAVEVTSPAPPCNQYRFIIPVGRGGDRAVVLWNRLSESWEGLAGELMPSFVARVLSPKGEVAAAA